jgi:TonB family protein
MIFVRLACSDTIAHMTRPILLVVYFIAALMAAGQSDAVKIVSAEEATGHIVRRVEPTVPPIAKLAKVGGKVKLHIVISASGEVSSATFLSGPPLLLKAAIDAVKQWKFKPFLEGDAPVVVATDVELDFPAGMSDGESAVRKKYFSAEDECRSLVKSGQYAEAETACRHAVELSEGLPKDVVLERTEALSMLANSIYLQHRFSDAIPLYEKALELNKGYLKSDDADLATDYENLGRVYAAVGNPAKSDEMFGVAVATFRAAIQGLPSMYENYSRRLKRTLELYAQLKDAEGQTEAASALRKQAAEINPYVNPAAALPAIPPPTRILKDSGNSPPKTDTKLTCDTSDCTHGKFAVRKAAVLDYVSHVAFTPDSKLLLAARNQGALDIWDTSSWRKQASIDTGQDSLTALAISPDGMLAATGSHGNTVKVWNIQSGKLVVEFIAESTNRDEFLEYLAFNPDASLLATGGNFTKGLVLDLQTHRSVASLGGTKQVQFSSDGNQLVGATGHQVLVWDTKSWNVQKTLDDPEKNVTMISIDEANQRIAIAGWQKGVRILDLGTGQLVDAVPNVSTDALRFNYGWRNLVTGRGTLGIWSVPIAKLLCETPDLEISDIALSPDGKYIAANLRDTIGIWVTEALGECMNPR